MKFNIGDFVVYRDTKGEMHKGWIMKYVECANWHYGPTEKFWIIDIKNHYPRRFKDKSRIISIISRKDFF